jgi:photosystem II stability/assembly factor-like uncharacterized protein
MKRLVVSMLVGLAVLLAAAPNASAFISTGDGSWVWQNPLPQGGILYDVDFVDATHGWAVGGGGLVLATSDGGATWQKRSSSARGMLHAVAFADTLHGWTAWPPDPWGSGGAVYATVDGGATWTEQPAARGMEDFACLDAEHVWAAGGNRILYTADGGATWSERWSGPADLHAIFFLDATHGWAVGESGAILATTDGGLTWSRQDAGVVYGDFADVVFTDTAHGWAVGGHHSYDGAPGLYSTSDGGATWRHEDAGGWFTAIAFSDSLHGCAVAEDGHFATTTDGGASWQWRHFGHNRDLIGVSYGDATHGCIVGAAGLIGVTADAGAIWYRKTTGSLDSLLAVGFADALHGIAVGDSGCVLHTQNGGATWARGDSGTTNHLKAICCLDASRAWAVGTQGVILRTGDGGATWVLQGALGGELTDVVFVDGLHGWAVGDSAIYATTDGGVHWKELSPPVEEYWTGVSFVDRTHGWVVGGGGYDPGYILATKDGGATWSVQWRKWEQFPQGVFFLDRLHGWVVPGPWVTKDGGATWTFKRGFGWSGSGSVCHIAFLNSSFGWTWPGLWTSSNGGATWTKLRAGGLGVSFADARHAWAVDLDGAILATSNGGRPPVTTTASGVVNQRWYRGPLSVTLKVADNSGGVGVAYTEYKLDAAPWVRGRSLAVSSEGRHVLLYRSADNALNLEYDHRLVFGIDTHRPTTRAPYAASVRRGGYGEIRYKVLDPLPNSGVATVTIRIRNGAGTLLKTLGPYAGKAVNKITATGFVCTLPRGTYRFSIYAKDKAGNPQTLPVGSNWLHVR